MLRSVVSNVCCASKLRDTILRKRGTVCLVCIDIVDFMVFSI